MKKANIEREKEIEYLSKHIVHKAQNRRSGSACLVPSGSVEGLTYRVDIDENFNPTACQCKGGNYNCKHKQATRLYFAARLAALLNNEVNPIYEFVRSGRTVRARLSQFAKEEKAALREQQRLAEEAQKRARYNAIYDPHCIELYA